jgi:hypothetical protein
VDVGLIRESPDDSNLKLTTYNIYSDNYLASLVLKKYNPDNHDWTGRAENINNTMQQYLADAEDANPFFANHINQYMALTMAPTLRELAFSNSATFTLPVTVVGATINTTINNQNGSLNPRDYSDIAFLRAVYFHERGSDIDAMTNYLDGVYRYDGKGFRDDPFNSDPNHLYQTYKLALYIYASKLLGQDYDLQAFYTILAMQKNTSTLNNGGFVTGYDSNLQATGSTNAETTSLVVLSLNQTTMQSPPQEPISEFGTMPLAAMVLLVAVVLAIGTMRRKAR